ncbi:MAG: stage III sporulation protein AD [Clostridia bacterium]|nr:stage III sporulation protein AD [Clostridia bacterium]
MTAGQIAGFAVCAAILALVLRRLRPEAATALVLAAGALALLMVLPQLTQIIDGVTALARSGGVQEQYMSSLLKICGVSLLMDFAAQTCRDADETGLAMKVELAGRIVLVSLALPVMHALLSQILSLSL